MIHTTMSLRPSTTARLPFISIPSKKREPLVNPHKQHGWKLDHLPVERRRVRMPLGVQGRNKGSAVFLAMLPTLTAWKLWGKEDPISIIRQPDIWQPTLPIHILLIIDSLHYCSLINVGRKTKRSYQHPCTISSQRMYYTYGIWTRMPWIR